MVHGLDVRTIRVENVSPVVARVIRPLARGAVVAATRLDRSRVKAVHRFAILGLEGDVKCGGGWPVAADEELVGGEPALSFACDTEAERRQRSCVKPLTRLNIGHAQMDVVEEPSGM